MADFSAFSPLNGGDPRTYGYGVEYPYDLDASLDFTRPATGVSIFPFPQTIGHSEGLCPLYDEMWGAISATGINATVLNVLNMGNAQQSFVFPDLQGGLRKVLG